VVVAAVVKPLLLPSLTLPPDADLLMSCATPSMVPFFDLMGTQRMDLVRNPVSLSTAWLNRPSVYASAITTASPDVATCPAIPAPLGMRISAPVELTVETSSLLLWSTRKTDATSAPRSSRASVQTRKNQQKKYQGL
jgi:hypothetical protein